MNKKYHPGFIHLHTTTYLPTLNSKDAKDSKEIIILIELKRSNGQDFMIKLEEKGNPVLLRKRSSGSSIWTEQSQDGLIKNKDLLGEVVIKSGNRDIKKFSDYDEFWEAIKRE